MLSYNHKDGMPKVRPQDLHFMQVKEGSVTNEEWIKLPYELRSFIDKEQQDYANRQLADHRPVYQQPIDNIKKEAVALYKVGVEFVNTISADEALRLVRYYKHAFEYGNYNAHKFVRCKVLGKWMIVTRAVSQIENVRALVEVLK